MAHADLPSVLSTIHVRTPQAESSSGAYYVITEIRACGLPEGHPWAKCLRDMVSALGLEPRTL